MSFMRGGQRSDDGSGDRVLPPGMTTSGPGAAERARTSFAAASSLRLGVAGGGVEVARHVVAVDGSVVMVVAEPSPVVDSLATGRRKASPVQLKAVDVAPVSLPERIRATVVAAGRIALLADRIPDEVAEHLAGPDGIWAERPLLRFQPRRIVLQTGGVGGSDERLEVDLDVYREARTDPLVPVEADWLSHLDLDHSDVLGALARAGAGEMVRPVRLDRHGIVLRVGGAGGPRHVRLSFRRPVACGCDLVEAIDDLVRSVTPDVGTWCG